MDPHFLMKISAGSFLREVSEPLEPSVCDPVIRQYELTPVIRQYEPAIKIPSPGHPDLRIFGLMAFKTATI